ncbi:MAG TPA: nuclear transport factor 2 family protein [Blastocatellia bacterium]|jgi:ketosteroid isomerase-like protein|nr:nuclear transport factor 2 family protein [Blastocatellia bacterium]
MESASEKDGEKLTETQQALLFLEEEIFTAIRNRDTDALESILTDDFVYRSPGSQEVVKEDFLKLSASFPHKIVSIWGEEMKVNIYGSAAVTTGLQFAKTQTDEGPEETSVVMFTDVFVKQKDKWMLSLAHAVDLPQIPEKYLQKN